MGCCVPARLVVLALIVVYILVLLISLLSKSCHVLYYFIKCICISFEIGEETHHYTYPPGLTWNLRGASAVLHAGTVVPLYPIYYAQIYSPSTQALFVKPS